MMEEIKNTPGLALMAECEECRMKFRLGSSDSNFAKLTHKKEYKVNGRSIYLTFYDCPSCGRRHYAQIDDDNTLEILKHNRRLFVKLAAKRANDGHISKKQSDKYKNSTQHLRNCRTEIMKKYTGTVLHDDETGTDFELRFSV